MKHRELKRFERKHVLEARNSYRDDALKKSNRSYRMQALDFLKYFDTYIEILESTPADKPALLINQPIGLRSNLNRIEGRIETYFKNKALGRE